MKALVIYSGGMDSFTLMNALTQGHPVVSNLGPLESLSAITFMYGQRHQREIHYAAAFCQEGNIPHKICNIQDVMFSLLAKSTALLPDGPDVPHGHYADESMRKTVVPNRNMIMLSLAIGHAAAIGADTVLFGAHAGDHAIYPDCRPEFVLKMDSVARLAHYTPIQVAAPFLHMDKGGIAKIGAELELDYGRAWTCYEGAELPCGKCGACVERAEAMAAAGLVDPLVPSDVE